MNDFEVGYDVISDLVQEENLAKAVKHLQPLAKGQMFRFHAGKHCFDEFEMNNILMFLKHVSARLEWYLFGHPDEPYFQVYITI